MATQMYQVYKCEVCGNIVVVVHTGAGTLVCCGQPMVLQEERTTDTGQEKHVPVVEKTDTGVRVKVSSVDHPMQENHYIEWIEITDPQTGWCQMARLQPGQPPVAEFLVPESSRNRMVARSYCNLHGLWKSQ